MREELKGKEKKGQRKKRWRQRAADRVGVSERYAKRTREKVNQLEGKWPERERRPK